MWNALTHTLTHYTLGGLLDNLSVNMLTHMHIRHTLMDGLLNVLSVNNTDIHSTLNDGLHGQAEC